MDLMQSFDAILFPADGRPPHVVSLMTSPASFSNPHAPTQTTPARNPHPEVHMEYIAEDPNLRAWGFQVCCLLCFFFSGGSGRALLSRVRHRAGTAVDTILPYPIPLFHSILY
jgi:hypothetical protein